MNTEIGKIQKQIHEASLEDSDTPLKKKLDEFGGRLTTAIGLVCLIVWVIKLQKFPLMGCCGWMAEFFTLGGKTTSSRIFHVEGTTYDPKDGGIVDWNCYNMDANLQAMAEICAVCNDAGIFCDGRLFRATGLPTEAALKVLVEKMGVPDAKARNKIRDTELVATI
ncbi:hypothetical protein GH714_010280 [Hevea brasiliensis]|uniref:Uncharacterized protein n=1 Tax=Hevea brasiliensis TaxID=3981 RepID=A0A6A6MMV6_HEVBR|nr:hypothetical protein GH714_010280 [Hevea brasiliensis]